MENVQLRDLQFSDAFALIRIIKKLNIKEEVKGLFENVKGLTQEQIAELGREKSVQFIFLLLENLDRAEQEIYEFLSNLTNIPKDEIAKLHLDHITEILMQLSNLKGLKNFLQSVGKLMNSK